MRYRIRDRSRGLREHIRDVPDRNGNLLGYWCDFGICTAARRVLVDGTAQMQACDRHLGAALLILMRKHPDAVVRPEFPETAAADLPIIIIS